jgi:hypothetical protein
MLPTYAECIRGRHYVRNIGGTTIRMYRRQLVYFVQVGHDSIGYMTYDKAIDHLIRALIITNQGEHHDKSRKKY